MKNFTQKFIGILALVFTISFTVNSQEIGDVYEGGYIFQINEDGTGLVADLQDLDQMNWDSAMNLAEASISGGYNDWYLPSIEELELMYSTIGQGADNTGGFAEYWYFSSSETSNNSAWSVDFLNGATTSFASKTNALRVRVIRSVTFGEDENTENSYLNLPEGWSMFGYTCIDSVDAMVGFAEISDKIEIVKDEWGLSYLPSWDFNAMGSLEFSEGYQIKMIEEVTDFQFCTTITLGASQEELDAAYDNGVASVDITSDNADVAAEAYSEGAASVTPEDGISQADLDALAESYAGYTAPLDLQIGDLHAGGIVFQINENGSGLVAAMEDSEGWHNWGQAFTQACTYNSEGYGWYLPSLEELELMYITIGQGSPEGNIGGFANNWYWSSSEYDDNYGYDLAWLVNFNYNGSSIYNYKTSSYRVRVIRAF